MTARQLLYDEDVRHKLLAGAGRLADVVRTTFGPVAANVLLGPSNRPSITKDGVTVAKEVDLADPFENMAVKLIKEAANKLADEAGDGTTTVTLLAEAMYREGLRATSMSGWNAAAVRRGMQAGAEAAAGAIRKLAQPISTKDKFRQIAMISANGDREIADLIAEARDKVGPEGGMTIEDGRGRDSELEVNHGVQWSNGYVSQHFVNEATTGTCTLENAYVLLFEKKISSFPDMVPLLEKIVPLGKPLFIIAEDVDSDALAALVINSKRGALRACAVKAPGFGARRKEILEDLAIVTGGVAFTEDLGRTLRDVRVQDLGQARTVRVTKDRFTILDGKGAKDKINDRVLQIRRLIGESKSKYDIEKYEERLQKLTGGVAVIKIGAVSESALKEKKARADDALHAVLAAAEEGIVPGGGVALLAAAKAVRALKLDGEEAVGAGIVASALRRIPAQIAGNAGHDGDVVVNELETKGAPWGFDALNGKYVNMIDAGIVDPAKVARLCIEQAVSISGVLLTTETLITDLMDKHEDKPIAGAVK